MRKNIVLVLLLVAAAILTRMFNIPNFNPVMALALFSAAALPFWLGVTFPLVAMFISDLIMGMLQHDVTLLQWMSFQPFVYGSFVLVAIMSYVFLKPFLKSDTLGTTAMGGVVGGFAGSLIFFLVTNLMVWINPIPVWPSMYTLDFTGLVNCFTLAIPFWKNSLIADLLFTPVLFVAYHLLSKNMLKQSSIFSDDLNYKL